MNFIDFATQLYEYDPPLIRAVIEGYNIIEGINDVNVLKWETAKINNLLDIVRYHDFSHITEFDDHSVEIDASHIGLPTIWFAVDDHRVPSGKEQTTGYSNEYNMIRIDFTPMADLFKSLVDTKDFVGLYNLFNSRRDALLHEIRHYIQHQYKKPQKQYTNKHKKERKESNLPQRDIDYSNSYNEINSFVIQHLASCIDNLRNNKHQTISFSAFTTPMTDSSFYRLLLPTAKRKVIKRMYYIWNETKRQLPDLLTLDDGKYQELRDIICKDIDSDITNNPTLESLANDACSVILESANLESNYSLDRRWRIWNTLVPSDVFIEGFSDVVHCFSIAGSYTLFEYDDSSELPKSVLVYNKHADCIHCDFVMGDPSNNLLESVLRKIYPDHLITGSTEPMPLNKQNRNYAFISKRDILIR